MKPLVFATTDYVRLKALSPIMELLKADEAVESFEAYKKGQLLLFVAIERTDLFDSGFSSQCKHISISHPSRYPTWDEIKEARNRFMPRDRDGFMVLPKKGEYVNIHQNCFHIWMPLKANVTK